MAGGDLGIAPGHAALHDQRAAHGVDDARKLDQDAIAGGLDDAAAMIRDGGIDQLQSHGAQSRERALLVDADQPAVAGDVRRQHGRQPAFDALGLHRPTRSRESWPDPTYSRPRHQWLTSSLARAEDS